MQEAFSRCSVHIAFKIETGSFPCIQKPAKPVPPNPGGLCTHRRACRLHAGLCSSSRRLPGRKRLPQSCRKKFAAHPLAGRQSLHGGQLASTYHRRQTGLMHRTDMPADEGMLFVFPQTAIQCFWMKNTPLPLTAAFVAADGTIVNLADMQPFSGQNHCSTKPVAYVLEMHRGCFKRHGVHPGMRLEDVQGQLFQQMR
nr:DUF192 domain-containing protein [Neisseria sp. WF04]